MQSYDIQLDMNKSPLFSGAITRHIIFKLIKNKLGL